MMTTTDPVAPARPRPGHGWREKGHHHVNANAQLRLRQANERIAQAHRHAAGERLADQARRRHRLTLRMRAAATLIQLGERLAAEPTLTSVRSS